MSDWSVGDLAVCVDDEPCRGCGHFPRFKAGQTYRVAFIDGQGRMEMDGLTGGTHGAFARRFRKIRPDAHEACEDEFVTLLKRQKVSA